MGFFGGCADHGPLCIAVLLGCGRVPGRVSGEMHFSGWRRVTTVIFPYERSSQHCPFSNGWCCVAPGRCGGHGPLCIAVPLDVEGDL